MNIRTLVDVGTGSGCLAIALSKVLPETRILATDLSARALTVARRNARRLGVDRQITFLHGDLFEPLKKRGMGPVDLIVSNPPYIASDELQTLAPEVKDHEPRMALDGGADGLDPCRRIILGSANQLHSRGALVMEIGWKQAAPLKEWINHNGLDWTLEFKKDLNGIDRVVILKKK